jgi:hypothetical protein
MLVLVANRIRTLQLLLSSIWVPIDLKWKILKRISSDFKTFINSFINDSNEFKNLNEKSYNLQRPEFFEIQLNKFPVFFYEKQF